jgi:thiol:disulfide interchange protein DsbD
MPEALAAESVGYFSVWLLGVSMGMTACTVTCLPFMGTWALGRASGTVEAFTHLATFLSGRIATYALLGGLTAAVGRGLAAALGGGMGNLVIGSASIIAGAWMLLRPGRTCHSGSGVSASPVRFRKQTSRRDSLPPLFLGAALSLTPCTPLASLLALSANAGAVLQGAAFGLLFGLGAAMTPILVLVPMAGRLGRELRAGRSWLGNWLVWGAAAVLIALGARRIWLAFA